MKAGWEKCKDASPWQTLKAIRRILKGLGVGVEVQCRRPLKGLYSARLEILGSIDGVNGKGTTRPYALASAYAELMERLQSQCIYSFDFYHQSPSVHRYAGFYTAPDEVLVPRRTFARMLSPSLKRVVGRELSRAAVDDYYRLERVNGRPCAVMLPYTDVLTSITELIPYELLKIISLTNGLAAGNTTAEAVVQALSELIERYATMRILAGEQEVRVVPRSVVAKHCAAEARAIAALEKAGISITVFDASPFEEIPVVGVHARHKGSARYLVKLGVHPLLHIALERCLTELLQGVDDVATLIERMVEFDADASLQADSMENRADIFAGAGGHFPVSFLTRRGRYPRRAPMARKLSSNVEMMEELVAAMHRRFGAVLIRDMSYLGFPTVSVYVPGMNEMLKKGMLRQGIEATIDHHAGAHLIRRASRLKQPELKCLEQLVQRSRSLEVLVNLPLTEGHRLCGYSRHVFRALIFYELGDYKAGIAALEPFGEECRGDEERTSQFKAFKGYLTLLQGGMSKRRALEACRETHGDHAHQLLRSLDRRGGALGFLPPMRCWRCSQCSYVHRQCRYPEFERLHKRLKRRYRDWHQKRQ